MLENFFALIGVKFTSAVAGFFGSLISLRFIQDARTWPQRAWIVACGTIAAAYGTPLAAHAIGATTEQLQSGMAFLIGMFGLTLGNAIYIGIKDSKLGDALMSWITRR